MSKTRVIVAMSGGVDSSVAAGLLKEKGYEVLCLLSQEQLIHTFFPLGNYTKEAVKEMARSFGLDIDNKPESQNFIAGGYFPLVEAATQPGPILDSQGDLFGDELIASELNWIAIKELKQPTEVKARIRYRHKKAEAVTTPLDESQVYIKFKEPQMAITPGQVVVFYNGDGVIGGGIIERTGK